MTQETTLAGRVAHLGAYVRRLRTGQGEHLQVAMQDSVMHYIRNSFTWTERNDGKPAPRLMGTACDTSAIERNVAFGRKHKITATPALVFADGRRIAGALTAADIDKRMTEIAQPAAKKS